MPLPDEVLQQLPEELRSNETLNRYDSLEALANSHLEQRSAISQSIRIPPKESGEEARKEFLTKLVNNAPELMLKPNAESADQTDEFYRVLGMPEEPAGYERPEDLKINEDVEAELRSVLHDAKLTNTQFQQILKAFAEREQQTNQLMEQQIEEDKSGLKGKWGAAHEDRLAAAERVNSEFFPGRDFEKLTSSEIEGLYDMSKALTGKGPQAAAQPSEPSGKLTPAECQMRIDEIMKTDAYWGRETPEAKASAVKRVLELREMMGGSRDMSPHRAEGRAGF